MPVVTAGVHEARILGNEAFFGGYVCLIRAFGYRHTVNVKANGQSGTGTTGIKHGYAPREFFHFGKEFFAHAVAAGAFQTGLRFAAENGYDCAMQMDADGQHKPQYIEAMLHELEQGSDIVIGSRFLTVKKPKTLRMLGSYIISWSIRLTTGRAICDPTSGMRMFNRAMVEEFAQNLNYGPEPDTISYLIKNGATVKEVQVEMGERMAGQSYLTFWRSVQYMVKMSISILLIQWFRKRDTETPYPERSL